MTQTETPPASREPALPVPPEGLDERSRRAYTEEMAVTPLGDGLYEVESASGNAYLVDVPAGRCTCPDHYYRDERCKHLRRVAIEITEGRVPAPGWEAAACAACDATVFVPEDDPEPHLCSAHRVVPGDVVRDRETGDLLAVVAVSSLDATEVEVEETGATVADYPSNRGYASDVPVVGVVYPQSVRMTRRGPAPDALRVYSFPLSRLERVDDPPEGWRAIAPADEDAGGDRTVLSDFA